MLPVLILLTSCSNSKKQEEHVYAYGLVDFGMSREKVVEILGEPDYQYMDFTPEYRNQTAFGLENARVEYSFDTVDSLYFISIYFENDYIDIESGKNDFGIIKTNMEEAYGNVESEDETSIFFSVDTVEAAAFMLNNPKGDGYIINVIINASNT